MTASTKNVYQRILAIMAEFDYVQKEDKKVNNQYTFASHDRVTALLHPMLVKHGVLAIPTVKSLTQDGNRTSVCLTVSFMNVDDPDDFIAVESWGYGVDPADKGPGKAVSYAFKYAILKTFCLATGDDPDQDAQSKYEPPVQSYPNPIQPYASPVQLELSPEEFVKRLRDQVGEEYSFDGIGEYLAHLEKEKHVKIPRIMEQALKPGLTEKFCKGWQTWYKSLE